MPNVTLGWMDYSIMLIYVAAVLGIGQALRKYMKSSNDFFLSGRAIPAWVTGLAFISANLGALELVGMAASGAKYGMMTCHFYWIGAILAMTFLAVFMMPFYKVGRCGRMLDIRKVSVCAFGPYCRESLKLPWR
jgi:solute:Na+ symporter, SSS family